LELFTTLGRPFVAIAPAVDERPPRPLSPLQAARWAASAKAAAVSRRHPEATVVAADTTVALDGQAFGKPATAVQAKEMLRALRGRTHSVYTAVAVINGPARRRATGYARSRVTMRRFSMQELEAYARSAEVRDKAGAYAIQGGGGRLVGVVAGPLDTVIGLPLHLVRRLLKQVGAW
jgi:nucleoside triphosphate pyrophosphatase